VTASEDPAVQSRRLRTELRGTRETLKLTQKEVAKALDWSASKLLRIENGSVNISRSDLLALAGHYGITDADKLRDLVTMAAVAKMPSWAEYRSVLSPEFVTYLGFESSASIIRQYQPVLIPGLLQTEEYARETIRALAPKDDRSPSREDLRWQARHERQQRLLARKPRPRLHFILDEASVRRRVGPGDTMVRQLRHLIEVSEQDDVALQLLPFSAGAHAGMRGPLVLLEFADASLDPMLYLENARGDFVSATDAAEVQNALETFFDLEDLAGPKSRFASTLQDIIHDLGGR
jgi:transcriptional regulator with XRE-family HTH domain